MQMPNHLELMNPTLDSLRELGGSATIDELVQHVVDRLNLPREITEVPHGKGSKTEVEYRLAWVRTNLKKYGLLTNSERGVWALTPDGVKARDIDPRAVSRALRRQERENKRAPEDDDTDDDQGDPTWRESLLDSLHAMSPDAFERLCQRLLRESGFIEVEVTGRSGDGGIDGHGIIRIAGLISFTVIFQAKRYRANVSPTVVRDFRGAMVGRADKGLIITTGGFSRDARAEAIRDGAPPIDLIDGELLVEKLKDLGLGVRTKMVEAVEVDADWFRSI